MSIQGEIDRIKSNLAGAYSAVSDMGGTLPEQQVSGNLAEAIRSIPSGGSPTTPLDPVEVYKATRPADWLPMPEPQDNEMYLLFHIPDGVSSLLAFTVTCTGSYTAALGTVTDGQFVQQSAVSVATGTKYETELFADDYGDLTSDGFKQVMVKVSGTDILTWEPSAHSKKAAPADFSNWNIVEIACKLPRGTNVRCGSMSRYNALSKLRYFSWIGQNRVFQYYHTFEYCTSLLAVLQLNLSYAVYMDYIFSKCYSLIALPELDTSNITSMNSAFNQCYCLKAIPYLNTSKVTDMQGTFELCGSLLSIPTLDTSSVTMIGSIFSGCYSLISLPQLDITKVSSMSESSFGNCNSLTELTLDSQKIGWEGQNISLVNCSFMHESLVNLFISLPTIITTHTLALTGNPGVSELTDAEKAIATNKNWTLTL